MNLPQALLGSMQEHDKYQTVNCALSAQFALASWPRGCKMRDRGPGDEWSLRKGFFSNLRKMVVQMTHF